MNLPVWCTITCSLLPSRTVIQNIFPAVAFIFGRSWASFFETSQSGVQNVACYFLAFWRYSPYVVVLRHCRASFTGWWWVVACLSGRWLVTQETLVSGGLCDGHFLKGVLIGTGGTAGETACSGSTQTSACAGPTLRSR